MAHFNDESYIIKLCDEVLHRTAARHHRFDFLRGDPGATGRSTRLPVDAYYADLNLVVEYHEIQHCQAIRHFDKRKTVSGVPRSIQRRRYDERRAEILPEHGIQLVVIKFCRFELTRGNRLKRTSADRDIVSTYLKAFCDDAQCLKPQHGSIAQ